MTSRLTVARSSRLSYERIYKIGYGYLFIYLLTQKQAQTQADTGRHRYRHKQKVQSYNIYIRLQKCGLEPQTFGS